MQFEIRRGTSATQPFYWRIVAANGQVLDVSRTYAQKARCQAAVNSVKANAGTAATVDLT